MKKGIFKRICAIAAVLAVSCTMLTACGEEKKNDDKGLVSQDVIEDVKNPEDLPDNEDEISPMIPSLTVEGQSVDISDNPVMLTVGGVDVPFDEMRYNYLYYTSSNGFSEEFWADNADLFPLLLEDLSNQCLQANLGQILANEYGITLDESDNAEIDELIKEQKAAYESEEEYRKDLEFAGFSEELMRRLLAKTVLTDKVFDELYGGESPKLIGSDDEIKNDIKENYVRVYHVLISKDHFSGQEGYEESTEDELTQAAKDLAEKTLSQIQTGELEIYDLAQSIGDDPGMKGNDAGYLFTYGTMVEPFEKASFALGVGDVSGLVETDYGWHIITRLEQENYVADNFDTIRQTYIEDKFNAHLYKAFNESEVTYSDYYNKMTPDSIT